jgi:hypothetical protein
VKRALCAGLIVALAAAGCGGDIRADELNRGLSSLQSAAGDGELLAYGVVQDRTKTTYVRAHARELAEDVQHEAEKLSDASAGPDVADQKNQAVELAGDISDALGQLQTNPDDPGVARMVRQELRDLADRAERIANDL